MLRVFDFKSLMFLVISVTVYFKSLMCLVKSKSCAQTSRNLHAKPEYGLPAYGGVC